MPPAPNNGTSGLGWKLFFGLLMLVQGISTTMLFRTYDAVRELTIAKAANETMVNSVILPTLARHDTAIERLKDNAKNSP